MILRIAEHKVLNLEQSVDNSNLNTNDNIELCVYQADIKPQTDGANGLKYNLTADIIESIFKTYPMGEP